MRVAPYTIPEAAEAVLLTIKSKVLLHTTSPYQCGGTIAHSLRAPGSLEPLNFCAHVRQEKLANNVGLTMERVDYNTVPVRIVEGRFEMYTLWRIQNYVLLSRDVFLTGYGIL